MPLVAAFALHLFAALRLHALVPRAAVGVLLTPAVLSLGAVTIANAAGIGRADQFHRTEAAACFQNESYAALARLPAGLVATDIDYGPFVLALTPHSVVAAPYHRLSAAIIAAHRAFAAPPERARNACCRPGRLRGGLRRAGARRPFAGSSASASLWGRLQAGAVPDWLEPVAGDRAVRVYRVKP